ncbi:winged helix-turn-helix transcriptional regulator [Deinococcus cellulosilyticus]|uniref:HTH hxlR-type domain-containing protein n=1 Tax=Deinococcus cellulosilyticus (strain DSM 18568 / NBRC 106333 / KACC 11606 / 5516J-15) TaxID=1223518 RepID=A0A511MYM9_DEIC1|nr:helix-turn-helix domain-containing protein [Deinococcus cellulosilyticus]GEM45683.1 hypothetical protein DC3_13180 [Deinococcus cellulosilyticus NBRC 106333 = KACC 11606]
MLSPEGFPEGSSSPALSILQERWALSVLDVLLNGEVFFNDLARALPEASPTTLQTRLKMLQRQGLVEREVRRDVPPSTLYRLTGKGETVRPLLESMKRWCMEHHSEPAQGATAETSPVVEVLRVLGQKWSLPIMMLLSMEARGFVRLMEALGNINSSTLKNRLDGLEKLGFVERQVLSGNQMRTLYRVTRRGAAFRTVMLALRQWEEHLQG